MSDLTWLIESTVAATNLEKARDLSYRAVTIDSTVVEHWLHDLEIESSDPAGSIECNC